MTISKDIMMLAGVGEEYLLAKDGTPIAKFMDGRLVSTIVVEFCGNVDETINPLEIDLIDDIA